MDHLKRLEKHQAMLQASVTSASRPLLPRLAYDESFAANGKLILPLENRTGWASCIVPSASQPSTFIVGFYEILKIISPQPDYLARLIRMGEDGEVDPKFGNDKGYMDVNFTHEGISVIQGIHETAEGFYVWGSSVTLSDNVLTNRYYISRFDADGQRDLGFGNQGLLDINSLGLRDAIQLMPQQACSFPHEGGIWVGVVAPGTNAALVLKLDEAGRLDVKFQNKGALLLTNGEQAVHAMGLAGNSKDGFFVCGATATETELAGVVMKYDRAGNKSPTFGHAGVSELWIEGYQPVINASKVLDDGRLLLVGSALTLRGGIPVYESLITMFNADGTPDTSFNAGKAALHQVDPQSDNDSWNLGLPQLPLLENMLVIGAGGTDPNRGPVVGRFKKDGSADTSFADGYAFATLDDASFFSSGQCMSVHPSLARIVVAGAVGNRPAVLALKI